MTDKGAAEAARYRLIRETDPLAGVGRWTPLRKRHLVESVDEGRISLGQAVAVHGLSLDEFARWRSLYHARGRDGLKASVRQPETAA